jgi:hypothetical protein
MVLPGNPFRAFNLLLQGLQFFTDYLNFDAAAAAEDRIARMGQAEYHFLAAPWTRDFDFVPGRINKDLHGSPPFMLASAAVRFFASYHAAPRATSPGLPAQ